MSRFFDAGEAVGTASASFSPARLRRWIWGIFMVSSNDVGKAENDPSYIRVFGKRVHRAWLMMVGCGFFAMATVGCVFSPIGVFYVAICDDMGFLRSEISIWQQVHFLSAIIGMPLSVKALERFGARKAMSACILGCALAAGLMGTYTESWQWCISGVLYGTVGAMGTLQLAAPVVIGNWFGKRTGMAMGIYGIIGVAASVAGAPLFSFVIAQVGWRMAYFVQAALILLLGLWFTLFVVKLRPSEMGARPYGISPEEARSVQGTTEELRKERAKVPWGAILSIPFLALFVFAGVSSLIGSGFDAHLAGHGVAKGYDAFFGSLMTSALFLGSGMDKMLMGWLNDKIGVNRTVLIEYAIVICGMLGLVFFHTPVLLLVSAFLFGVQDSFISVSLPLLVRKFFGVDKVAQVLGWVSIGSGIFGSFGSRLVGYSYDATGSFDPAFLLGVALCLVGVGCIMLANLSVRKKEQGKGEAPATAE